MWNVQQTLQYFLFPVMYDVSFVNNTAKIGENPKVTAINSCIEVDLTGQVCADSIGSKLYSGNCIIFLLKHPFTQKFLSTAHPKVWTAISVLPPISLYWLWV